VGGTYLFSLAGIPVSVSGTYLFLIGYYVYSGGVRGLLFGLCMTVSLLVHEFGHALIAKFFRLSPNVTLWGLGGVCAHDRALRDRDDAAIVAAGPGAGLAFGALGYLVEKALWAYKPELLYGSEPLQLTFYYFFYINIYWSLVNLLPLWPLDGGQLFRLLMQRFFQPAKAARITHMTGIATAAGVLALVYGYYGSTSLFVVIFGGVIIYLNGKQLNDPSATGGPPRRQNTLSKHLLRDAEQALAGGDPAEAMRLCHQARSDSFLPEPALNKAWAILAVACYAMGDEEEARDYEQRAPEAMIRSMLKHLPDAPQDHSQ
jgi:stage IV sporulation protein FB